MALRFWASSTTPPLESSAKIWSAPAWARRPTSAAAMHTLAPAALECGLLPREEARQVMFRRASDALFSSSRGPPRTSGVLGGQLPASSNPPPRVGRHDRQPRYKLRAANINELQPGRDGCTPPGHRRRDLAPRPPPRCTAATYAVVRHSPAPATKEIHHPELPVTSCQQEV
ncbi:uncharacterized protein A4U43_C01F36210 [Asparagus officinalis]|uniref:Uncharacterized protein n=1 Tax=Asparagus officinalis TaxID=4686 RepID=A0A5P1FX91_ASPOF|nr:uncharacterized protein A4U43_C01F36210 [Asparagus officinalis]